MRTSAMCDRTRLAAEAARDATKKKAGKPARKRSSDDQSGSDLAAEAARLGPDNPPKAREGRVRFLVGKGTDRAVSGPPINRYKKSSHHLFSGRLAQLPEHRGTSPFPLGTEARPGVGGGAVNISVTFERRLPHRFSSGDYFPAEHLSSKGLRPGGRGAFREPMPSARVLRTVGTWGA